MSGLQWIILMVVYSMEYTLALSLNFCIVVLHGKSLTKRTKLNPSTIIQLIMGVINITMRTLIFTQFLALMFPIFRFKELYDIMAIVLPFQMYISNGLISWLCAYYCTSIVHFTYPVFIWVRRTLSTRLPYVLVLSGVGSIAMSISTLGNLQMTQMHYSANTTVLYTDISLKSLSLTVTIIVILLGSCVPFIISSISLMTTVVSLLRHIWSIKQQDSGFSPSQVQVHVNAIRTMILLLLLSSTLCISEIIVFSILALNDLAVIICWVLVTAFPAMEAAIIIQSNPRLSKIVLGRFCIGRATESES